MVELYCPDKVMWQLSYRQHILVDINTSDALHTITYRGKNDDYAWFGRHNAHVSQWDA